MGPVLERFRALVSQVRALGLEFPDWDELSSLQAHEVLEVKFGFPVHEDIAEWFGFTFGSNAIASGLLWDGDGHLYDYGATVDLLIEAQSVASENFEECLTQQGISEDFKTALAGPYLILLDSHTDRWIARGIGEEEQPSVWHISLGGGLRPFLLPRTDGIARACTLPELLAQRQHDFDIGRSFVDTTKGGIQHGKRYQGQIMVAAVGSGSGTG